MSKHTPGPWVTHKAEGMHGHDYFVMTPEGFLGYLPKDSEGGGVQLFRELDARLIAAAPELLRALEMAMNHLDAGIQLQCGAPDEPPQPASQWDYEAGQLAYELRQLIAKATAP